MMTNFKMCEKIGHTIEYGQQHDIWIPIDPQPTFLYGHKYDCPDCGRWWIAQDDSQELENGDIYCPYCDDYVHMTEECVNVYVVGAKK